MIGEFLAVKCNSFNPQSAAVLNIAKQLTLLTQIQSAEGSEETTAEFIYLLGI